MNDTDTRMKIKRVEVACVLICPMCKHDNVVEPAIEAFITQRGLVIVCRLHEEEVCFTLAEIAERMASAAEREVRGRLARNQVGSA
jgi:hypothetical protein